VAGSDGSSSPVNADKLSSFSRASAHDSAKAAIGAVDKWTACTEELPRGVPGRAATAAVKDGVNTFPVRAEADADALPPDWWRPGMSGVARISAGHRSLGWIISHRLVDYLRLALWI
jgi:hypothetical protein